jgi:hypothetical protein
MAVQAAALRKHCDTISLSIRGSSSLSWHGRVKPAEYTECYWIELDYRTNTRFVPRPRVFVRDPLLKLRLGRGCPHRHGDHEPCLYYHHGTEWNKGMLLADTIVPWTSRWLYFYEIWLATGEWMGGGIPHDPSGSIKGREQVARSALITNHARGIRTVA